MRVLKHDSSFFPCSQYRALLFLLGLSLATQADAQSYREQGAAALQKGDAAEGVALMEKALVTSLKALKEGDLEVVIRRAELGEAYHAAGRWNDAIQQFDYTWKRARYEAETKGRWQAEEGDLTISYAEKLGRSCHAASRYQDALMVFSTAIQDSIKAKRNESELNQFYALQADTLLVLKRVDEASKSIEKIASYIERRFNEDPLARARMWSRITDLYFNHGLYNKAKPFAQKGLDDISKALKPEEEEYATYQANLGAILLNLGDIAGAEKLLVEARKTMLVKTAPDSARMLFYQLHIAELTLKQGKPNEALKEADEALRICKLHFTDENPEVAKSLSIKAACYKELKQTKQAWESADEALTILLKTLGKDHTQTIEAKSFLATLK